jgi:hypothetical protein
MLRQLAYSVKSTAPDVPFGIRQFKQNAQIQHVDRTSSKVPPLEIPEVLNKMVVVIPFAGTSPFAVVFPIVRLMISGPEHFIYRVF